MQSLMNAELAMFEQPAVYKGMVSHVRAAISFARKLLLCDDECFEPRGAAFPSPILMCLFLSAVSAAFVKHAHTWWIARQLRGYGRQGAGDGLSCGCAAAGMHGRTQCGAKQEWQCAAHAVHTKVPDGRPAPHRKASRHNAPRVKGSV